MEKKYNFKLPKKYEWVDTSSPAFREALEAIQDETIPYVIIAGPGGCGKSLLYRIIYDMNEGKTLCTATTGVAAFNISKEGVPATTIHSALHIKPADWYDPENILKKIVKILQKTDILLIDEISMMNCNLMDYIIAHVEEANKKRIKRIKVVLFGDVMQLLPVTKGLDDEMLKDRWVKRYGENHMFFNSPNLKAMKRKTVELYDVHRQSDEHFRMILNSIRLGDASEEMLEELNRHVIDRASFEKTVGANGMMYLAGTNSKVEKLNNEYEEKFKKEGEIYAFHEAEIDRKLEKESLSSAFPGVPEEIAVYKGQQVMCIANDSDSGYQNGTIGKVVDFKNGCPVVSTADGRRFVVKRHTFTRYKLVPDKRGFLKPKEAGSVTQLACKSAYAVTYHKAQGLTLDAVYMDISGWMAPHSIYLGLSRLRSLEGLGLSRRLRASDIRIDNEAIGFFSSSRDEIVKRKEDLTLSDFLKMRE